MVRTAVVLNPSRFADPERQRKLICKAFADAGAEEPLWWETTPADPGGGQTREAQAAGVDVVLACGGDGTVRACADVLAGTDTALGVLPAGTGNLLVANLDLPSDVDGVVAAALGGNRRRIDLGRLDDQHFAVMAGIGFDAAMMDATRDSWKRTLGWPAYLMGGARRLFERPMRVRLRLDGGAPIDRLARTVLVANLGRLQGGIDLFGDAQPDDGVLDVAVVTPRRPADWIALATSVVLHRVPNRRHLQTFRASTVDVRSRTVEPRELDGDTLTPGDRLTVSVRPQALWVCVP